jgi:SAM-dependent methyltransferase
MNAQVVQQPQSVEEAHWQEISSDAYDQAVYQTGELVEVYEEEIRVVTSVASETATLIEVGCGTGHFLRPLTSRFPHIVGIDLSSEFLQRAASSLAGSGKLSLLRDDAVNLAEVLTESFGPCYVNTGPERVICCVMNTLGIMPAASRRQVLAEIGSLQRPSDSIFLVFFNRKFLPSAVERFYRRNPGLCGPVRDSDVDLVNGDLRVAASGYYSHWFEVDEVEDLLVNAGINAFKVKKVGWSIFVGAGVIASPLMD